SIIFQTGCSPSGGNGEDNSSIEITPDSLDFDSTLTQITFNITYTGGDELAWNVTDNRDWISLNPASGTVSNEIDQVAVSIDRVGLAPDSYSGIVTVTTGDGSSDIPVTMIVPVSQTLAVSHTKLLFRTHLTDISFYITNAGSGTLTWSISNNQSWLSLSPLSGNSTTEADTINAVVDRTGLEPGDYVDTVFISSDGGIIEILVLMTAPEIFENGTEYFPMTEGDTWYYTWTDYGHKITRTVSGDTVILGNTCTRILENDTTAEAWTKDANGFYVHLLSGNFYFDPPLAIPFYLEEGIPYNFNSNSYLWVSADSIYSGTISGQLDFMGYISKTVPAGQYDDVIKLYYQPDDEENYYEYYARGVGLLDNGDYILDSAYIGGVWYR
ncbi:MAG: hypothetical protein DRP51_10430, partial [Candidatus Zixiibacteriota bacterium]